MFSTRTLLRPTAALLLTTACLAPICIAPSPAFAQGAKLVSAVTAKGAVATKGGPSKAVGVTTVFKPSDREIYCLYRLNKPMSAYGRSVWTAIKVETIKPNTVIYDVKTKSIPNFQYGKFSISNSNDWPRGQYKVAIYANTTVLKTLYFSVK